MYNKGCQIVTRLRPRLSAHAVISECVLFTQGKSLKINSVLIFQVLMKNLCFDYSQFKRQVSVDINCEITLYFFHVILNHCYLHFIKEKLFFSKGLL